MNFQFLEGEAVAVFVTVADDGSVSREELSFVFAGFSNEIHPFFQKQIDFAVLALSSKGVNLNITTVATVDDMGAGSDRGFFEPGDIDVPKGLEMSEDGNTYCLLRDKEMGRGWSVLYKVSDGVVSILSQDHRDSVRDEIMKGEFIRSFGVDYVYSYDSNLTF